MSAEILIVDDDTRAGTTFAKLIESQTRISSIFTDDPDEAIQILHRNHVKIAILDQRMPKMKGTDLVRKLKEIEPKLRVILFSGQADLEEVQEAVGHFYRFVDKNDIMMLPELVRRSYDECMAELADEALANMEMLSEWRSGFSWRGERVEIYFTFLEDPNKDGPHIWLDDEFKQIVRLESGQTREILRSVTSEAEVLTETELQLKSSVASEWSSRATGLAPMKIELANKVKSSIESSIRTKFQGRNLNRTEEALRETFTLPAQAPDGSPSDVRAREIQRAPVYLRKRALSRTMCGCCGMERFESFNVLLPTGQYRTRHIDYRLDGSKNIVDV